MNEDNEIELFDEISKNFPQLDIEDVTELTSFVAELYESKDENLQKMKEYISSKVSLRNRKAVINYNVELYRHCCEKHLDNGKEAMNQYIEELQHFSCLKIWETKAYYTNSESFSGEYKQVFVWCENDN